MPKKKTKKKELRYESVGRYSRWNLCLLLAIQLNKSIATDAEIEQLIQEIKAEFLMN